MRISYKLQLLIILLTSALPATHAESLYLAEIGSSSVVDTYLSPLHYSGTSLALSGEWTHFPGWGRDRAEMIFHGRLEGDLLTDRLGRRHMYYAALGFGWGVRGVWSPDSRISLHAGGEATLTAGCLYLRGNGNNPATAKAGIDLGLTCEAAYRTHIAHLPLRIADEVELPVIGGLFSQQYAEPYYEIYLGNHRSLLHAAHWGNRFAIDNLLTATLSIGKREMAVGYRFRCNTTNVEHIDYRRTNHNFVIGLNF